MASSCVNNAGMSPKNFIESPPRYPLVARLSPGISFSRDFSDDGGKDIGSGEDTGQGVSVEDFADFEFRLDYPATMLSADELFADGKLLPLHLGPMPTVEDQSQEEIRLPAPIHLWRRVENTGPDHLCPFSPKGPRCSSRWKELLGLKKAQIPHPEHQNAAPPATSKSFSTKSAKLLLHRNPRSSSSDSSLSVPLLQNSDSDSVSISAHIPLDHDLEKMNPVRRNQPRALLANAGSPAIRRHSETRVGRSPFLRAPESVAEDMRIGRSPVGLARESGDIPPPRSSSVDSPRLNASGKVVFQGLERSSSSPSALNGGPRPRPRGVERTYTSNVRVAPVLNVFDFGQLFLIQKKEKVGSSASKNGFTSNNNGLAKIKCEKSATQG